MPLSELQILHLHQTLAARGFRLTAPVSGFSASEDSYQKSRLWAEGYACECNCQPVNSGEMMACGCYLGAPSVGLCFLPVSVLFDVVFMVVLPAPLPGVDMEFCVLAGVTLELEMTLAEVAMVNPAGALPTYSET